jgi:carbon-monoxide dehydrogenase medium subunit
MKPAPFEYYAPTTLEEAVAHVNEHGYDAKLLAGGQSLIPMMNFRLAQPSVLVDLNNIPSFSYIQPNNDGGLTIGCMTRHYQVESSSLIAERSPLITETMPKIATSQIRSRGTFGGSIAHADPSAELVALSVALNSKFRLVSKNGERSVAAKEFFVGLFTTLLEPEEILIEAVFPPVPSGTGWALEEVARRPHDFALVGVAAVVTLDAQATCQQARLVFMSVGDIPVDAHQACQALKGQVLDGEVIREASELAANKEMDPGGDIHASADFRRHLAKVLAQRALIKANHRALNDYPRSRS